MEREGTGRINTGLQASERLHQGLEQGTGTEAKEEKQSSHGGDGEGDVREVQKGGDICTPLPGKSHGWKSLVGCSPWGR